MSSGYFGLNQNPFPHVPRWRPQGTPANPPDEAEAPERVDSAEEKGIAWFEALQKEFPLGIEGSSKRLEKQLLKIESAWTDTCFVEQTHFRTETDAFIKILRKVLPHALSGPSAELRRIAFQARVALVTTNALMLPTDSAWRRENRRGEGILMGFMGVGLIANPASGSSDVYQTSSSPGTEGVPSGKTG